MAPDLWMAESSYSDQDLEDIMVVVQEMAALLDKFGGSIFVKDINSRCPITSAIAAGQLHAAAQLLDVFAPKHADDVRASSVGASAFQIHCLAHCWKDLHQSIQASALIPHWVSVSASCMSASFLASICLRPCGCRVIEKLHMNLRTGCQRYCQHRCL